MKKFLIFQTIFVFFLLISYEAPSYGQGKFAQFYNKAIEYYKQGKYDQAREEFKKALELKPNDTYALYGLGNTHYCKANYDEAVKVYTKAIKVNPNYPKVHYSLSLAYSKLGMTRDAEREKEIFRKLSQGKKGVVKTPKRVKPSPTKSESKEALSKAMERTFGVSKEKSIPKKEEQAKVPVKQEKRDLSQTLVKQESTRPEEKTFIETQRESVTRESPKTDESQTIFKGYTQETPKAKPRVYVKKYRESYKPMAYIKGKWNKSGLNKVFICALGYIFAIQMWLCTITFFGVIIWRIRKKTEE